MELEDRPQLRWALPLGSETRWSDLLAVLMETDPSVICGLLGLLGMPDRLRIEREAVVDSASRPDIVHHVDGRRVGVVEVKVLSGLGVHQLHRYEDAEPDADAYLVVYAERLALDVSHAPRWRGTTWQSILRAHCSSSHPWVAATAHAWMAHLDESLPKVGPDTIWNELVDGEDFVIAMRARMCWVHNNRDPPSPIQHDFGSSSAGVSWVARMFVDTPAPGYRVLVDVEENLPVREFPKIAGQRGFRSPLGPSVKVVLLQHGVDTSAAFDWDYLHAMWPLMNAARTDWVRNTARPKSAHDREGHRSIISKGAPPYLGIGFGERQARINKACMFGARFQLRADIRLADVVATLHELCDLILQMSAVQPPQRG